MIKSKRQSIHYVNNKDFSQAVVDYCTEVQQAKDSGKPDRKSVV
jgi:hypothetical protein